VLSLGSYRLLSRLPVDELHICGPRLTTVFLGLSVSRLVDPSQSWYIVGTLFLAGLARTWLIRADGSPRRSPSSAVGLPSCPSGS